jgi:hypothetical protein
MLEVCLNSFIFCWYWRVVFFYNTIQCMYVFYFDSFYWYYLAEFIKTTIFYVLTGYFALSIIRFKITPLYVTKKYVPIFMISIDVLGSCSSLWLRCTCLWWLVSLPLWRCIAQHHAAVFHSLVRRIYFKFSFLEPSRVAFHVYEIFVAILFFTIASVIAYKAEKSVVMSKGSFPYFIRCF